jgi:hypothetical protein
MTITVFPAPFYTFLLALVCSAPFIEEKRETVERLRIRRLRWKIRKLARLGLRFVTISFICLANQQPK